MMRRRLLSGPSRLQRSKHAAGSKRLLSPQELAAAVTEVAKLARDQDVDVALLGGYALQQYGSDRLTSDLDFVADAVLDDVELMQPLSFGGYGAIVCGVPVDFIVRDDRYGRLYREALSTAVWIQGLDVPVVQPAYLLAMKMAARRSKDDADIEFLLENNVVDIDRTAQIVEDFLGCYAADEFLLLVDELKWLQSRRNR